MGLEIVEPQLVIGGVEVHPIGAHFVGQGAVLPPAEQLEEGEFEPMFADLEGSLSGVKVALFGSYGWGSGQWLEDWCARCKEDGAVMQEEPGVMANEAPDDDAIAACNALGAKLAVC